MQQNSTSITPQSATPSQVEYEPHCPVIGDPLPDPELDDLLDEVVERSIYMNHDDRAYWV
jgi:hypothetical protein